MKKEPLEVIENAMLKRAKLGPLGMAVAVQLSVLIAAVSVVVMVPQQREEPAFVAQKKVYLPQQDLEHKVALAEFQNAAGSPMQMERIATSALLPESLPTAPAVPADAFNAIDSGATAMHPSGLLAQSGIFNGLKGLKADASNASLFGIADSAARIVILYDNSATVWNKAAASGVSTDVFVAELCRLLDGLGANTLFGLVPFARNVGTYKDELVNSGARNREAAKAWIATTVRATRKTTALPHEHDGIQGALEVAYQMQPEVIFIISDADFQRSGRGGVSAGDVPWQSIEQTLQRLKREQRINPRIHFIGFQVETEAGRAMRSMVRRYHGQYRNLGEGVPSGGG